MGSRAYFVISGTIFGLVAILHLLRALYHWPFQVGTMPLAPWVSWIGVAVAAALCIWAFRLASR